jgi:prolyl-tRNA editing enzyme YbaK/EbsC (Cys-tRNA(Pro) deacylase)
VTTARAAAEALGVEVGQIANSLVFVTESSVSGTRLGTESSASGTRLGTESSASGTRLGTESSASAAAGDTAGQPLLVLASGAHRVDTAKLAAQLGVAAIKRADPRFVKAVTGQVIGGVAPVGHPAPIRTLIDETLAVHAEIWAAAGHPHTVFPTTFSQLVEITGAEPIAVN